MATRSWLSAVVVVALLELPAAPGRADPPGLAQFSGLSDAVAGWKPQATKEGVTLERRAVPGSSYFEYRAILDVPVDAEQVARLIWQGFRSGDMETLKHREMLRATDNELLIYDQIKTPIVQDRDYVIEVKRVYVPDQRRTEFRCATVTGVGPAPAPGHVRIPIIRAGWMVEQRGSGARITYYAYSEPGGYITALIARGAQAERSMADMLRMKNRLQGLGQTQEMR